MFMSNNCSNNFIDFKSTLITRYTRYEPDGDFPHLKETLDYFKVALSVLFPSFLFPLVFFYLCL